MYFLSGGISTHISPFATPQDIGALLQGAGFVMITMDTEDITVRYPDLHKIMRDLQVSLGGPTVGAKGRARLENQDLVFSLYSPPPLNTSVVLYYHPEPYLILNHITQCKIILL